MTVGQQPRAVSSDGPSAIGRDFEVIVERLRASYPELVETDIRLVVLEAAHSFEEARLRPFVPLLVEKIARDECRHRTWARPGVVQLPD